MGADLADLVVVTNPAAGRGRAARVRDAGVARLRAAGHRVRAVDAQHAAEALEAARRAVAEEAGALVVCGGDGAVSVALQALAGSAVPLGILPAGRRNDAARAVGVPLGDPVAAAEHLLRWRPRPMDLARTGDRWFATVLAPARRAPAPARHHLDLDGRQLAVDALLVAVANGPSTRRGLRTTAGAVLDDGLLDVVVVAGPRARQRHRVRRVTLASPGVVAYADGARVGALPLTIESVPGAVTVLA